MEPNSAKPKKRVSQRDTKTRAATLPAGAVAPAVLFSHKGGGFFGKLRRCLRLGGKGKYDFNHSTLDAAFPSDADRNAESRLASVEDRTERPCQRASPLRVTRRQDKEEVILIRKDKRTSGVLKGVSRSEETLNEICNDVFVVKFAEDSTKESLYVSAAAKTCEDQQIGSATDEVFDELDPDYETLDEVRKKVRGHVEQDVSSSLPSEQVDTKERMARQGIQSKDKTNNDVSGRDSGLGSPFTDSPVFSSHSHSPLLSEASECLREGIQTSTFSSRYAESKPGIGIRQVLAKNSGSQLDNSRSASELDDEDIYANSKVIIRKKSSKRSQVSVSSDRHSFGGLSSGQAAVGGELATPTNVETSVEDPARDSLIPPPLPERNYSEEDFASVAVFQSSSCPNVTRALTKDEIVTDSGRLSFRLVAHMNETKIEKDGRHSKTRFKTSLPETDRSVSSGCETQPCVLNECGKLNEMQVNISCVDLDCPSVQNHISSLPHRNPMKDSAIPSSQSETQTSEPAETDEVVSGDIMIVSASDSMCEITADSQMSADLIKDDDMNNLHEESAICTGLTSQTGSLAHAQKGHRVSTKTTVEALDDHLQHCELENHSEFPVGALLWLEAKVNMEGATAPKKSSCANNESDSSAVAHKPESAGDPKMVTTILSGTPPLLSVVAEAGTIQPFSSDTAKSVDTCELKDSTPSLASKAAIKQHFSSDTAKSVDTCELKGREPPTGPLASVLFCESQHSLHCGAQGPPPLPLRGVPRRAESCTRLTRSVIAFKKQARETPNSDGRRHSSVDTASSSHLDFLESMKQLKDCGWYWGPLSYEEAESKLGDKPDGSFLVRDSSNENYILSLSFKSMGHVHHTRIEHHKGLFSFWSQPDSHGKAKICQFIEQTVENSKNGRFLYFLRPAGPGSPPLPIQLLYPVSRFCRVPSLQHMCRFLVLRWVRRDHVDHLPIPQKVKAYLLEKQYYVETLEED